MCGDDVEQSGAAYEHDYERQFPEKLIWCVAHHYGAKDRNRYEDTVFQHRTFGRGARVDDSASADGTIYRQHRES